MAETVARLSAVVAARGLEVYAVIDHSARAREHGLPLRDTTVLIVGSPPAVVPLLDARPLAALDVPLRVVVWVDGHRTLVSYPDPAAIARRHGLEGGPTAALSSIDAITNAVIDR
jgi:uncharacterized protein (DUF302 family)